MIAAVDNEFVLFGTAHLAVMALTLIVPAGLAAACGRGRRVRTTRAICWAMAGMLVINEFVTYIHSATVHGVDSFLANDLPLHLCGVAAYMTAYTLVRPHQLLYELALFWGLAGTVQAIITPNISAGFPSFPFVRFFITHCGIVAGVLYATWGLRMRPRLVGVLYAWLAGNAMAAVLAVLNALTGWNYMFLCAKPEGVAGDSPFFAPGWPWYILMLEPVALLMFWIFYTPFPIADRLRRQAMGSHCPKAREDSG